MTTFSERPAPLSEEARGAVVALIRVIELYDPAVAHRAVLRATVASRLIGDLDTAIPPSLFVATAALADVDLTITRPLDPESSNDPSRTLLADTILGRLPGLSDVAVAVATHRERWDGKGVDALSGEQIPLPARVQAAADVLVANPAAGFLPGWEHGYKRLAAAAGSVVDPHLAQLIAKLDLEDLEAPLIPSSSIQALLEADQSAIAEQIGEASTITTAIAAAGEVDDVLTLFARTARDAVAAQDVVIINSAGTGFAEEPSAQATRNNALPSGPTYALDFAEQAELQAGVALETSTHDNDRVDTILAPIMADERCLGVMIARRGPEESAFGASELGALRHVANEAGSAIASSGHWAQMQQMALCDQLTGLANRHELYRVLDAIFERDPIDRVDTALIMCDVDGLKVVNDSLGHQEGDRLLMDAAGALRGAVRDPHRTTVCRIGGDEFCMVIDGGALLTAHEISDTIERLFARSGGAGKTRSISCGIAFGTEEITSRSALLRAADQNQYETKRTRKASRGEQVETAGGGDRPVTDRRAIRD